MSAPVTSVAGGVDLAARDTLRLCTAGSVDDGKSTFVGRLLHDTHSVLADQLDAVERSSKERGFPGGLDFSLLVDGLRAEREQGITIDVAYRYFATEKRTFILADTPGHVQYTRNTVTGMSTAQLVVLLVDARNGVVEQTKRHLSAAALLGVDQVVLAVNKIDLVDFDEQVFRGIESDFVSIAARLGIGTAKAVPISALGGDNVAERSERTPWYGGETVLDLLETLPVERTEAAALDFRFPVQYVIREHETDYRGYAGRVAAGAVAVGDEVALPEGRSARVTHVDTPDGPAERAAAGESVTLRLDKDVDLARGDLISAGQRPEPARRIAATLVGLGEAGVRPRQRLTLRYGPATTAARITAIEDTVDLDGGIAEEDPGELKLNDIAHATVELQRPLPVEDYAARGAVGAFLLADQATGDTVAAGLVGRHLTEARG